MLFSNHRYTLAWHVTIGMAHAEQAVRLDYRSILSL
jgi:hypothetical protein